MTNDTLDDLGRRAATELHIRTRSVDTEAALAALTAAVPRRTRWGRVHARAGQPVVLAVAAAFVVLAVAASVAIGRPEDRQPLDVTAPTRLDPASYGPIVATATGLDGELVELRARFPLFDGDRALVTVSRVEPGTQVVVDECLVAVGDDYNTSNHCTDVGGVIARAGDTGVATIPVRIWARYDGRAGGGLTNDCAIDRCNLVVNPVVPAEHDPDPNADQSPLIVLPLTFAPDPLAPPVPTLTYEPAVGAVDEGATPGLQGPVVRILADGLRSSRSIVYLSAFRSSEPSPQPNEPYRWLGQIEVANVEVGVDGTLDVRVVAPTVITLQDSAERVTCGSEDVVCELWTYPDGDTIDGRLLEPRPVPYPQPDN